LATDPRPPVRLQAEGHRWGAGLRGVRLRLEDLPDIKAYAEALVTSPEVLEKFTRRRFVSGYEREEGEGGW